MSSVQMFLSGCDGNTIIISKTSLKSTILIIFVHFQCFPIILAAIEMTNNNAQPMPFTPSMPAWRHHQLLLQPCMVVMLQSALDLTEIHCHVVDVVTEYSALKCPATEIPKILQHWNMDGKTKKRTKRWHTNRKKKTKARSINRLISSRWRCWHVLMLIVCKARLSGVDWRRCRCCCYP